MEILYQEFDGGHGETIECDASSILNENNIRFFWGKLTRRHYPPLYLSNVYAFSAVILH